VCVCVCVCVHACMRVRECMRACVCELSVNVLISVKEVTLRQARLVLGWVTIFVGHTTLVF